MIDNINEDYIRGLITNRMLQNMTVEYKAELPELESEKGKDEFLADIVSFANSAGGYIFYGIEAKDGGQQNILGVNLENKNEDTIKQQIESIIRDMVEPRIIPSVKIQFINCESKKSVLVIRVPKSWCAPHMVGPKDSSRFYCRNSAGKYHLDCSEIRSAFLFSENLAEKIRNFRNDRLAKIVSDEIPCPFLLGKGSKLVLHILPLSSFKGDIAIDIKSFSQFAANFHPVYTDPGRRLINFYGVLAYSHESNGFPPYSYCQVFRTGQIESVTNLSSYMKNDNLPVEALEREIVKTIKELTENLKQWGPIVPFFISIAWLGVKDCVVCESPYEIKKIVDQDLILPEIMFKDYNDNPSEIAKMLRTSFDLVWNAGGYLGSPNFDKNGDWIPKS